MKELMTKQALFVDLANIYSGLLDSGISEPRFLRDYFLYWFDFDRLAEKLTGEFSPIWVFYSGRYFGPKTNRIQDTYLDDFIDRINSLVGVTARDVDIRGSKGQQTLYKCSECSGVLQLESEKGVDASLTVQLFDTMDSWDMAFLLSGDADFVPVVASLRRRGKIVIGAGFSDVSSALVLECYDFVDLHDTFFLDDFVANEIFKEGGIAQMWLSDEVLPLPSFDPSQDIELTITWYLEMPSIMPSTVKFLSMKDLKGGIPHYIVELWGLGPVDITNRQRVIEDFSKKFPMFVKKMDPNKPIFELVISPLAWNGVLRRIDNFPLLKSDARIRDHYERGHIDMYIKYHYDENVNRYIAVTGDGEVV